MDLSTIDPELIRVRGEYATVNGAYKDSMEELQKATQKGCDLLRAVLQDEANRKDHLVNVEMLVDKIAGMVSTADELREQKDALKLIAWGKD